jgi:hypothetical protein
MPKTRRELLLALADRIGGAQGERLRAALAKKDLLDDIIDRPMSDEEFTAQLEMLARNLPATFAKMKDVEWEKPGTWGLPN